MLKKFGGNSATLWRPKNPHSLDYLRYLHGILVKNDKITEANRALVIEALRTITEVLIWGDQNDGAVFDFFLERQMFSHFLRIMQQDNECKINVQLLQTLNILFENIRNETSLYFLLSNNHVNSIITQPFDFANEEIIAYYISFLKTLSFKLNPKTVHFFFIENTDEFPLFTESIKFYRHSESMVRIAVRTLTLNIFKVMDDTLNKFVLNHSGQYFNNVCYDIASQIVEMDTFARSAQNEQSNRSRLMSMMDVHLDGIHYLNDILSIGNDELNNFLIDSMHRYLFGPIYLASLASVRAQPHTILVSRVSALFLLSQFLQIVHVQSSIQILLTSLFFGDQNDISTHWIRTIDGILHLSPLEKWEIPQERIFFHCHLNSLNEGHDDHACFYALLLIYCICQNMSVQKEVLYASQLPYCSGFTGKCDPEFSESLIRIIENCSLIDTPIRPLTIDLCCVIVRRVLLSFEDGDQNFQSASELAVRRSLHKLLNVLRGALQTEKLFLEMFEDEYFHFQKNEIRMKDLLEDPGLYLPPSNTPLSGVALAKRMPSGNDERIRRTLQFFFILRKFGQDLSGDLEQSLPLSSRQEMVELNDCINLNNSDLLSCTVVFVGKSERLSRFLVTDQFQLILVEPDNRRLGWAIVRFVCLLQDVQVNNADSRTLQIVVEDVKTRAQPKSKPLMDAKLIFDDHIRCMAAKQRLSKGKKNSRTFKLGLIAELFGMRLPQAQSSQQQQPSTTTAAEDTFQSQQSHSAGQQQERRMRSATPGTVQKVHPSSSALSREATSSSSDTIPPDPETGRQGSIHHV